MIKVVAYSLGKIVPNLKPHLENGLINAWQSWLKNWRSSWECEESAFHHMLSAFTWSGHDQCHLFLYCATCLKTFTRLGSSRVGGLQARLGHSYIVYIAQLSTNGCLMNYRTLQWVKKHYLYISRLCYRTLASSLEALAFTAIGTCLSSEVQMLNALYQGNNTV